MKIGYSFWGFLDDGRRTLADALLDRGHDLVLLQPDRDLTDAGRRLPYRWDVGRPPLDLLMLEWCRPVPGRNTTWCGAAGHTCELHRQTELVDHYVHGLHTPAIVWHTGGLRPAHPSITACPAHPARRVRHPRRLLDVVDAMARQPAARPGH